MSEKKALIKFNTSCSCCCNHSAGINLECGFHHEWNVREEEQYMCMARTSNNRVIMMWKLCRY